MSSQENNFKIGSLIIHKQNFLIGIIMSKQHNFFDFDDIDFNSILVYFLKMNKNRWLLVKTINSDFNVHES
tara:strand:+ start:880 stop:1092 length:213 start_codon:yes stop_codon:yes gene_type:complete